jgi:hypothetical protein
VIYKKKNRQTGQMSERKLGLGLRQGRPSAARPGQDPHKYLTWPESGISAHPAPAPGDFADIISDDDFNTTDSSIADDTNRTLLL